MHDDTSSMKTDLTSSLSHLGLSPDAIKTYLACLDLGKAKASDIAKTAHVPRTAVYEYLDELERSGLIHLLIENGTKTYTPSNPEIVSSIMHQHLQEIEGLIPFLMAQYTKAASERPGLRFYPGIAGMRLVMEEVLRNPSKEYLLFGSIQDAEIIQSAGLDFVIDWTKRRIAAGVWHKNLRVKNVWKNFESDPAVQRLYSGSGPDVLREIRYVPEGIRIPVLIYLYEGHVSILSGILGKQYGAIMESQDLYLGLTSIFNFLWEVSTPPEDDKEHQNRAKK